MLGFCLGKGEGRERELKYSSVLYIFEKISALLRIYPRRSWDDEKSRYGSLHVVFSFET